MSLNTPVAFIIFNRPDLTQVIFNAIRDAQPKQLFVIADGPRSSEELEECKKTRDIVKQVDWDCELKTRFLEKNMGGPYCCSSGITWVFTQVETAIILEDDCLPSSSFFEFCQELLNFYKDNKEIMHITGNNFQQGQIRTKYSYYFSKYTTSWGWATWRSAWEKFDLNLNSWTDSQQKKMLNKICSSEKEVQYWTYIFNRVFSKESVHWDYAWQYACWYHNGLTVVPEVNLVSNLGFGVHATHTKNPNSPFANLPKGEIYTLKHPNTSHINEEADKFTFDFRFNNDISLNKDKISIKNFMSKSFLYFKNKVPEDFRKRHSKQYQNTKQEIKNIYGKIVRQIKRPDFPSDTKNAKNLHLGCGMVNHPSFINMDGQAASHIHFVRGIDKLKPFQDQTIDLIYASHCLEHFPFNKIPHILLEWKRVLKIGGILRLSVPDFDLLLDIYSTNNQEMENIMMPLLGGQNSYHNFHMTAFNQRYLTKLLKNAGFSTVQQWKPGSSYLTTFNDWSCRLVIINGVAYPVSLNLEAIK